MIHADASNMLPIYDVYSAIVYASNNKTSVPAWLTGNGLCATAKLLNIDKTGTMESMKHIVNNELTIENHNMEMSFSFSNFHFQFSIIFVSFANLFTKKEFININPIRMEK